MSTSGGSVENASLIETYATVETEQVELVVDVQLFHRFRIGKLHDLDDDHRSYVRENVREAPRNPRWLTIQCPLRWAPRRRGGRHPASFADT